MSSVHHWEAALLDLPDRPPPPKPLLERARSWLEWAGPSRVVATSLAVIAVLGLAYWLVRPPAVATESTLPYASVVSSTAPPTTMSADTSGAAGSSVAPSELVVHVAGAVTKPGVYRVPAGSRVIDAVELAGGLAVDAEPDAVNLAAPVADGERVYLPRVGEPVTVPTGAPTVDSGATVGPVNLNSAGADELDELPGVGPATAAAIVAHRELHGPFGSVDDLADVRGIGPAKLAAIRELVTV